MREAAQSLIGEHDFSAFRSAECQAASPVKIVREISIERRGAYWRFEFDANAFLHHMVRNIVGSLVAVGTGQREPAGSRRCWLRAAASWPHRPLRRVGCTSSDRTTMHEHGIPDRTPAMDWLP